MSYVRHKSRAFRDAGDIPEVVRRRSEGRLKSYPSTEDARAWCDITDDRRQQILDYIISDIEQCSVGKYVPIDVIISTLLANKKSDCGKLQDEVDALKKKLEAYSKLEPKEEQKPMLDIQPRGVRRAADIVIAKTEETPDVCAAIKREQEGTSCAALDKYPDEDLKSLIIKKDAEIIALKNQLAAKQSELDQILAGKSMSGQPSHGFKEVEKERDNLKKELQASKHEIQSLKTRIDEPCVQEIEKLEKEIQRLKSKGQLTADEEAEIIRKEIDVLKKYCAKLATIQEENQALKLQVETLKKQPEVKPALTQRESLSSVATVANMDIDTLRNELNNKIAKLNEVIAERDNLKEKIKQLEKELLKHQNLPDDIDTVRRKSEMLDSVSDECRKLRSSLESMKTVEQEMKTLKKRACKADKLQNDLDSVNKEIVSIRNKSAAEIQTLKSKNEEIVKERETYKKVAMEAKSMGEELKCLAHCAKEAEALKRERDCLKSKLQKLHGIEAQYRQLQHKVKYLENIQSEREMYKIKYEEMLGLECDCEMLKTQVDKFKDMDKDRSTLINQVRDCECCIAEQEEEIKKLIAHIDNMSKGNNEQQARLQREINNMKNELKQKNNVIATSEQQLSSVQEQLRKTIKGVSCETSCLRSRIAELQEQLNKKTNVETDKNYNQNANEEIGDEHYKEMIAQSKYAVKRISEELEKHFKECETISKEDLVRLSAENKTLKKISVEVQQTVKTKETSANAVEQTVKTKDTSSNAVEQPVKTEDTSTSSDEQTFITKDTSSNAVEQTVKTKDASASSDEQTVQTKDTGANAVEQTVKTKDISSNAVEQTVKTKDASASSDEQTFETIDFTLNSDEDIVTQYEKAVLKIKALEKRINEYKQDIERLTTENAALKQVTTDYSANNNKFQQELNKSKVRSAQSQNELDTLTAENSTLRKLSVDLQNSMNDKMDNATDLLKAAKTRIAELESLLKNVENERDQLDKILRQYKETEVLGTPREIRIETGKIGEREEPVAGKAEDIEQLKAELIKCKEELQKEIKYRQEQECAYKRSAQSQSGVSIISTSMADSELRKCREEKNKLLEQIERQKNEIAAMIAKGVSPDLEKERKEKESMQNLIDQLQRQIAAMEGGAPVFDNDAFNKLKAQLENEQKKAMLAEAKLKEICEKQGISVPVIEVADVKRLSQAYEERLSQAKTEAELASSIKKQQDQEIKSLHSKYNDGLAKLQTSHEEVLKELDVEHAKELENLRSELRSSKETILTLERIMGSDKQSLISFKSSKKSAFEAASVKGSVRKTLSQKELSERGISERGVSEKKISEKKIGEKEVSEKKLTRGLDEMGSQKGVSEKELGTETTRASQGTMASIKKSSLTKETQENVEIPPTDKREGVCKCGAVLLAIVQKVIQYGFESLNFEELKILHNKTCEATAALLHKCPTKHVAFTCGPLPNDEDRQRLIKRIAALENDLLKKQKHTQEKVGALQVAVRIERQRLQDFKNLLETEKNRNNELMCKIGAQSRTVANMQIERETMLKNSSFNEERLQSLVQHCEQKKRRIKKLEEDLAKQKAIHRKEMESLYNLQMRTPVPGSNNPTSRLCSSCSRRENKRRQSMDGEVDSHIPENLENTKAGAEQCCTRRHRHTSRSSRSPCQSDLDEVD